MTHPTRMLGFSLLEVMVALIIISIGMLGIAKMQGLALSSTTASRSRALASIEASSFASAMQANRFYWSASAPNTITITTAPGTCTPSNVCATFASSSGAMTTAISAAAGSLCPGMGMNLSCYCASGYSAPCTPAAHALGLAAADVYDFGQELASFLPNSTTTVTCNEAIFPAECIIYIAWNENTVALNSQQSAQSVSAGSQVAVSFTLNVIP
jgi:type IV pilus assembly protein PilV